MFGVNEQFLLSTIIKQSSPFLIKLKCVTHLWFNDKCNLIIRPFIVLDSRRLFLKSSVRACEACVSSLRSFSI